MRATAPLPPSPGSGRWTWTSTRTCRPPLRPGTVFFPNHPSNPLKTCSSFSFASSVSPLPSLLFPPLLCGALKDWDVSACLCVALAGGLSPPQPAAPIPAPACACPPPPVLPPCLLLLVPPVGCWFVCFEEMQPASSAHRTAHRYPYTHCATPHGSPLGDSSVRWQGAPRCTRPAVLGTTESRKSPATSRDPCQGGKGYM